jgi:4-amino-4-deoxy-L-arabinose transferase-like glycosyltransferase
MVVNFFALRQKEGLLWKDLALLVFLLGGLFLVFLGHRPLGIPGEGRYIEIPREMLVSGDFLTPTLNGLPYFEKPPLFYWIEAFFIHCFGLENNFFLRLPIAFFALLGCVFVFLFGRALIDRKTGLWSSFVLGTSLLYFALARVVILDLVFTVFMTGALMAFFMATQKPTPQGRRGFLILYGLLMGAGVMTKGLIGIFLPGAIILLWIVWTRQWIFLKFAFHPLCLLAFFASTLPWHVAVCLRNPEFFNFYFLREHVMRYLTPIHRHDGPFWFFLPILVLGFFPWVAFLPATFLSFRQKEVRLVGHLTSFLMLWGGFVFIFFSFSSSKLIPYLLPVFPPLALLVSSFLSTESPRLKGAFKIYGVIAFVAGIVILSYFPIRNFFFHKSYNLPFVLPQIMGAVLLLWAGVLGVFFYLNKNAEKVFSSLTTSLILFLVSIAYLDPFFQRAPSIEPLIKKFKPYIKPDDPVIACSFFPHDVPVYLERPIQVLDYEGELAFGASITPDQNILINEEKFQKIWAGEHRVFLLMPPHDFTTAFYQNHWKTHFPNMKLYFIDSLGSYHLLTNKP